jgi:hypothetical protein
MILMGRRFASNVFPSKSLWIFPLLSSTLTMVQLMVFCGWIVMEYIMFIYNHLHMTFKAIGGVYTCFSVSLPVQSYNNIWVSLGNQQWFHIGD